MKKVEEEVVADVGGKGRESVPTKGDIMWDQLGDNRSLQNIRGNKQPWYTNGWFVLEQDITEWRNRLLSYSL